ncbi:MAG TPA: hypothetical protein VFB38_03680 [Chthonomonadaceae bacterium]|nr:hypothetical protein [Chthonomonadaceae bacterium]
MKPQVRPEKQPVSPFIIAACFVVLAGILVFIGMHVFGPPPAPPAPTEEGASQEKIIKGHKVPPGVPSDYMDRETSAQGQPTSR